jgi:hypothetical protein
MAGFTVKLDEAKLQEITDLLGYVGENSNKALCRAINKSLSGAKTDSAKEIYQVLNLAQKRIKENMQIKRATYKNLNAKLWSTGESIPLIDYGATGVKSGGITVKIKKNQGKKSIRGAFVARMKSGHVGIFWRTEGPGSHRPSAEIGAGIPIGQVGPETYFTFPGIWPEERRLPILELKGTKVEDVFGDSMDAIQDKVNDRFSKNLDHEVTYLLRQHLEDGDGYAEVSD